MLGLGQHGARYFLSYLTYKKKNMHPFVLMNLI
jgi:hypothetical protein